MITFDLDGAGPQPPSLICAGQFDQLANVLIPNQVARWNGTNWAAVGTGLRDVLSLAVFDDGTGPRLYAGGNFRVSTGQVADWIARWNGSAWEPIPGSALNGAARALVVHDDGAGPALFIGGGFTSAAGSPTARLAAWNGASWRTFSSGPSNNTIRSLHVHDDGTGTKLYAGGNFTQVDSSTLPGIACWNGAGWSGLGSGVTGTVERMETFAGKLYAAGNLTAAGGSPVRNIACWSTGAWSRLGTAPSDGVSLDVRAMRAWTSPQGPRLLVTGPFTQAGPLPVQRIAQWDGAAWSDVQRQTTTTPEYLELALFDDGSGPAMYLGGAEIPRVAKYGVPCSAPSITLQPIDVDAVDNVILFRIAARGTYPLSYQWRRDGVNLTPGPKYQGINGVQLSLQGWSLNDEGHYDCVVTNSFGSAISNSAELDVNGTVPGSPVNVTPIVYPPQVVPGGANEIFTEVVEARLAPSSEVYFLGAGTGFPRRLCKWDGSSISIVARPFDTIADTAPGEYITPNNFPSFPIFDTGINRVWFAANLGGPTVGATNRLGVWRQTSGEAQLVWRAGQPAPGFGPGITFGHSSTVSPGGQGTAGIFTHVVNAANQTVGRGIWHWTGNPSPTPIALTGQVIPGLTSPITAIDGMHANQRGQVVFAAGNTTQGGVWLAQGSGRQPLCLAGSPTPDIPTSTVTSIGGRSLLSSRGRAVFDVREQHTPGGPIGRAIYRWDGHALEVAVRSGMAAPGASGTFNTFSIYSVNRDGDVLFWSALTTPCFPPSCASAGMWVARASGEILPVALNNVPPPGAPPTVTGVASVERAAINDSGIAILQVGLAGNVSGGGWSVVGWRDGDGLFPIAIPGTQMEVLPDQFRTVREVFLSYQMDNYYSTPNLNNFDDIVIEVLFSDASSGIFKGEFGSFLAGRFPCDAHVSPGFHEPLEGTIIELTGFTRAVGDYRWFHNGVQLVDDARITGSASPFLTITDAQLSDSGEYQFQVLGSSCGPEINSAAILTVLSLCGTSDFNGDEDFGTDADIEAFFACLAGSCCPACFFGGSDFNGDGDYGTDQDIEAFFRVLAGGNC
jgi:hypothetical protein